GLLVHRSLMDDLAPRLISSLHEQGCELRGDAAFQALDSRVRPAQESDWGCEHLDAILSLRCVDGLTQAIDYIHHYGSNHTDSIVSEDAENVARFMAEIDSAIVMHNASTQFADGAEFGMGAEIGIATGRMHARGPIGVAQLTCYKYQVFGDGHCRK
ncbi:MAG: gamma-glutamyl-phosphate reductase, partial [Pseudomonadota bacterium]